MQGERSLTGVPSIFIRTSGCNLRCTWCDTPYASWNPEGRDWSIEEILAEVARHPAGHVVLTGGEPMVAAGIHDLAAALRAAGKHITIETAGTVAPAGIACDLASLNHFHLLVETPEPNLVTGMKTLLGGFSQAWNRRRRRMGHVFQGRYKSVSVSGEECDAWCFRIVADYIHLNPARAGLAGGNRSTLTAYRWSSVASYDGGKTPPWQDHDRVLKAFELSRDGRGRRAYVAWLEARAAEGGKISPEATKALKQGWHLGPESFRDRLLGLLDGAKKIRLKGSQAGGPLREHGAAEAERLLFKALPALELPTTSKELAFMRKADPRKAAVAILLRKRTAVANSWIAERLAMGHASTVRTRQFPHAL